MNPLYSGGFSLFINKIRMGLSIVYFKGPEVKCPKL